MYNGATITCLFNLIFFFFFSVSGNIMYRGCIFSNVQGCTFPLRDFWANSLHDRSCNQCLTDLCNNPAGKATIGTLTVVGVALMGITSKWMF